MIKQTAAGRGALKLWTVSPATRIGVSVPTGFACFPSELLHVPEMWVRQKYSKLLSYSLMARGGHFAAMEEPQLMADDIQNFAKKVEKNRK